MYEIDEKCQKCKNNKTAICNQCDMYYDEFDPIDETKQTNADKIHAMSDEELAEWRSNGQCPPGHYHGDYDCMNGSCKDCWLDWLRQEVSDEILR